ncbi:MAG: 30S ribosomal protein S16 [Actinomycetia bacterium]|nr:30S ribosomal protein S16 [Actinomycetes bacterium]
MSVKIRLTRTGFKKRPFYRIVVTDSRSPRDGKFIENIGTYDPKSEPSKVEVDKEKALEWIKKGAKPSNTVQKLFEKINLISSDNK